MVEPLFLAGQSAQARGARYPEMGDGEFLRRIQNVETALL
jgi:hypothetical protein